MLEKVVAIIQEQLNLDGVDITESSSLSVLPACLLMP